MRFHSSANSRGKTGAARRPGNCLNLKFYLPFKLSNKTPYRRHQSPVRTQTSGFGCLSHHPAIPSRRPITDLLPYLSSTSSTRMYVSDQIYNCRSWTSYFTGSRPPFYEPIRKHIFVSLVYAPRSSSPVMLKADRSSDRTRSRRRSSGLADRSRCLITLRPVFNVSLCVRGNSLCGSVFLMHKKKEMYRLSDATCTSTVQVG